MTTATEVSILELTVCANVASNFASAKRRKEDRYAPLIADLEARGLTVIYVTLELGTLGHYTKDAPPSPPANYAIYCTWSIVQSPQISCKNSYRLLPDYLQCETLSILVYIKTVLCYLTHPCLCFCFSFVLFHCCPAYVFVS